MRLSRRHFLAAGTALPIFAAPQAARPGQAWYRKMRRCGQVNFNEMDPGRLDVAQWVDYWSSLKLDALLLNAGGIMTVGWPIGVVLIVGSWILTGIYISRANGEFDALTEQLLKESAK